MGWDIRAIRRHRVGRVGQRVGGNAKDKVIAVGDGYYVGDVDDEAGYTGTLRTSTPKTEFRARGSTDTVRKPGVEMKRR